MLPHYINDFDNYLQDGCYPGRLVDSEADAETHGRKRIVLRLIVGAIMTFGLGLYLEGAYAADKYRAFYYNPQGELIQVEDVPDIDVPNRIKFLKDTDATEAPPIKRSTFEKISGTNVPMSKLATFAIYYTYSGANEPPVGTQNVQALPVKIEDLQFVPTRTIAICLPRVGSTPCVYPHRCHCVTGSCCCW